MSLGDSSTIHIREGCQFRTSLILNTVQWFTNCTGGGAVCLSSLGCRMCKSEYSVMDNGDFEKFVPN